jgi:hypothetical protein
MISGRSSLTSRPLVRSVNPPFAMALRTLWDPKTPITLVSCVFGRAGRQSESVNRLA